MNIRPSFSLKGKVALITGASKGIGKAMAYALGMAGASVIISSRKQDALDEVAAEFKEDGIDVVTIPANVGDMAQVQKLVADSIEARKGIDILINNAAANPVFGPVVKTDESAFDKIMNVNVKGPFELGKLCYPSMKSRGGGSVINISSVGGISPEHFLGIYSVSKAALISLTKVQAKEWGRDNIRSNAICPGLIKTKFSQALWDNEKILKQFLAMQPIPKMGNPEDIAGLALFLASDASAYCTGGVFTADGGYTA